MTRFTRPFSRYGRNTDGNVAAMFALTTFALVGGLALSIDLANARAAKQRLQDTTDAVALMAAQDKSLDTVEKMTASAQALYDARYPGVKGQRIEIAAIQRDGDRVSITTKNNIDTYFSGIFGRQNLDVGVSSSAVYADKAMDISLVLDSTYSMTGARLASLKTSATGLVKTIDELDNDKIRVAVVPFAQYVNVGLSRRNAPWLDVPADRSERGEEVCPTKRRITGRYNPRRIQRTCTNDGISRDCSYTKYDYTYGEEYQSCSTPIKVTKWHGCVGSRTAGYDERAAFEGRTIPGLVNVKNCPTEVQPLSNDLTKAKASISGLQAKIRYGDTYIPSGILWGWRSLSESAPLSSSTPGASPDRQKVMIVMTDGDNKASKSGKLHKGENQGGNPAKANTKTADLCEAAKRDDVTIYTIAYEVTDGATIRMLDRCATDGSKFFDARNASDLNAAFQQIGASLIELRIAA